MGGGGEGGALLAWPTTAASPQITMDIHISDWTHKFQDKTGLDAKAYSELYKSNQVNSVVLCAKVIKGGSTIQKTELHLDVFGQLEPLLLLDLYTILCGVFMDATFHGGSNDTIKGHVQHRQLEIWPICPLQLYPILGISQPPWRPYSYHRREIIAGTAGIKDTGDH